MDKQSKYTPRRYSTDYEYKFTIEQLKECYLEKRMSQREIAKLFHCDVRAVRHAMKAEGIQSRTPTERFPKEKVRRAIQKRIDTDPTYIPHYKKPRNKPRRKYSYEELYELYINKKMSIRDIGKIYGVSGSAIAQSLKILGIPTRVRPLKVTKDMSRYEKDLDIHYRGYQSGAEARDYEFSLPIELFEQVVTSSCHYCGAPPSIKKGKHLFSGIDRTDNKLGYISTNVRPCCITCNRAKMTQTEEKFIEWVLRAAEHLETNLNYNASPKREVL